MGDNKEIDAKYYENMLNKRDIYYEDTLKAIDIVKRYIIREGLVLKGGMVVHNALKLKNPNDGIYDNQTLPDLDFYSSTHFKDAYEIATWLVRIGLKNVSCINAIHPTTMKVRVNFVVVADITFIHDHILNTIPTIKYKGMNLVHPHFQMIDQHRSMSIPYEGIPRENIMFRLKKDMKRYDLLYEKYPISYKSDEVQLRDEFTIKTEHLQGQCVGGFAALNYWIGVAKAHGFKHDKDFGKFEIPDITSEYYTKGKLQKTDIVVQLPLDSHGITVYSDKMEDFYRKTVKEIELLKNVIKEQRFYERLIEYLPRKVIIDNNWEIFENTEKIAAHRVADNIYVTNIQHIMMYLLINYNLLMKIKNIERGTSFCMAYVTCRNMIIWASKKYYEDTTPNNIKETLAKFFPTCETYGEQNINDSVKINLVKFNSKNQLASEVDAETKRKNKELYSQPHNVYDQDLKYKKVPKAYYDFVYSNSLIFNGDGEEIDNFIEPETEERKGKKSTKKEDVEKKDKKDVEKDVEKEDKKETKIETDEESDEDEEKKET